MLNFICNSSGKRPLVDQRKNSYEPLETNTETDCERRERLFKNLQDLIPNAVAVKYWKAEKSKPKIPETKLQKVLFSFL